MTSESTCSGSGIEGQPWFDYWNTNDCTSYFQSVLFTNNQGQLQYNPTMLPRLQGDFAQVFSTYQATNSFADPGQIGYDPFQDVIIDACTKLPNVCFLEQEKFCVGMTDAEISASQTLVQICGCVAPPPVLPPGVVILPACTGLCSRVGTIPTFDSSGNPYTCTGVCVIDDVSIAATNSTTSSVNFDQVCNSCNASSTCLCIVEGISITNTLSQVGLGSTNFSQSCGASSVCILDDASTGNQTVVPCGTTATTPPPASTKTKVSMAFIIALLVIVLLIVFIVLAAR